MSAYFKLDQRAQAVKDTYQHGQAAYHSYQQATSTSHFTETAKYAWQHKNDTMLGYNTYGVQPFRHPFATYNTYSSTQAMRGSASKIFQY